MSILMVSFCVILLDISMGEKQRIVDVAKRYATTRLAKVCLGVVLLFVFINLTVYGIFLNRTFPNTNIAKYSLGATDYNALSKKIGSLPLLPPSISLQGTGQTFSVATSQIGVEVNSSQIVQASHKRSWLPVANFFVAHNLKGQFKVNQDTLTFKLNEIATTDQVAATDAQIALQNNQFTLINSKNGFRLNLTQAAKLISMEVVNGNTSIKLPFNTILPKVSDASLEPTLQQLRAQLGVSISYTYNGNTIKVSTVTVAGWYAETNGQFSIQPSSIQAYINQLGAANNIQVKNLSDLVSQTETTIQKASPTTLTLIAAPATICSPNSLNQLIIVSISQRHMWACSGSTQVYDSAVVTGMENLPADLTPTGTYTIYAKQTNLYLNGSDSTGSWHDYVYYWMPFLSNQYGVYGFHDATWRPSNAFGNISPDSSNASHGCVEMPLATAKWLFNWAPIGTTVSIVN
jgi:lipoprotein-anchoring transpeptidase ErfK/SrfK